ncbi:PDZ domain-containing protein [Chitinophaga sedimenti]|uniref:PDZ domain-containing protein n=1 Tax=Chitinophaga sedimenti TaxID=2033606 RepID=UPI00355826F7
MRVLYVNPASPAFKAGVVRGDRITAINGTNVNSSSSLLTSAFNGPSMTLTVTKSVWVRKPTTWRKQCIRVVLC